MANLLKEGENNLVLVNYTELLQLIIKTLETSNDFAKLSGHNRLKLIVDLDPIAQQVSRFYHGSIFGTDNEIAAKMATINFSEECSKKFPQQIRQISEILNHKLIFMAQKSDFVKDLLSNLASFKNNQAKLNLKFNFPSLSEIKKQELTIDTEELGSKSCLKLHKVTIRINQLKEFEKSLKTGVENYLEQDLLPDVDQDKEDQLKDILDEKKYIEDLEKVKGLVDTEALGQLKRYAMIKYLEYIASNIDQNTHKSVIYLQVLIKRLKILCDYLNNPTKPDGDYEISYGEITINLKQLLARSEAFDSLPIIPMITGLLGETTGKDDNFREFVFGLKMKLNGEVQTSKGESSFKYHLNLINPNSKEHQEEINTQNDREKETFVRKIIRNFCLYYFCLTSNCQVTQPNYQIENELNYNPLENWENYVIPVFKGNDEAKKRQVLASFANALLNNKDLAIENKLEKLVSLLRTFLGHQTRLEHKEYPIHLSILRTILEKDTEKITERGTFFKTEIAKKEALQYLNVGEAETNSKTFAKLPGNITIEDIRYFQTENTQQFNLEYDLDNLQVLPVLLTPKDDKAKSEYGKSFQETPLVVFPFDFENEKLDHSKYFTYYFTLFLLIYLTLKVITDKVEDKLFIPILRLHVSNRDKKDVKQDLDKDMGEFSKILVQLLGDKHLCNSQGFDLKEKEINSFKIGNGLTSLYSVIPKNFSYQNPEDTPKLDKLAMMVVSSRECDSKRRNPDRSQRLSNIYGEVITVNLLDNKKIQIKTENKISGNYPVSKMYSEPTIILDTVTNLYRQGYEHILYLAQTPFTSTLHLTKQSDDDEGLFFLSKKLIKYLYTNNPNVKLYPLFFDQYYVRKVNNFKGQSLSVQNTKELIRISNDPNQETVVFFNLFNGVTVDKKEDKYNGVLSYSTLVGVYQDIMEDQHINENLLYDSQMKKDILKYLTLFHFYRYEKSGKNITLKLDPYQGIIGDDSVGKKSLFHHKNQKADFNILAFLTEVRNAILV